MNYLLESQLHDELTSDERLLWSGAPRPGLRFDAVDLFMVPFSIMWGGFAFYWEYQVLQADLPMIFALWGIPFVLIGIYLIAGRFFFDARRRSQTVYGLTDRRILVVSSFPSRKVASLPLDSIGQTTWSERPDRSGTIVLGTGSATHGLTAASGLPGSGKYAACRLEGVENAREIHERILKAQHALRVRQMITPGREAL